MRGLPTKLESILGWIACATVVQFVTYFIFGIIFFNVFNYAYLYSLPEVSPFLRPTVDPLVMAGPFLQLVRGPIIGLAIYPVRKVFLEEKHGWILLWGLMLGLMIFALAGAAPGSVEGLIYKDSLMVPCHLLARNDSPYINFLVVTGSVAKSHWAEKGIGGNLRRNPSRWLRSLFVSLLGFHFQAFRLKFGWPS